MTDKEKLAQWMIQQGYATGHGDTVEDLLKELEWQIKELKWVGMTDEEMKDVCYQTFSYDPYVIARVIETKLKEKNT